MTELCAGRTDRVFCEEMGRFPVRICVDLNELRKKPPKTLKNAIRSFSVWCSHSGVGGRSDGYGSIRISDFMSTRVPLIRTTSTIVFVWFREFDNMLNGGRWFNWYVFL